MLTTEHPEGIKDKKVLLASNLPMVVANLPDATENSLQSTLENLEKE